MQKIVKTWLLFLVCIFAACQAQEAPQRTVSTSPPTEFMKEVLRKLPPVGKVTPQPTAGAPDHITRNIIQDRRGDIWLATFAGMFRFNGTSFTNETAAVTSSRFFSVLEAANGDLWFGTIGEGLYRLRDGTMTNYSVANGLVSNKITNIYEDANGTLWFGGVEGISRYDGQAFTNFTEENGLCDNDVNDIIQDKNGEYWIGTRGIACRYDGEQFRPISTSTGKQFSNVRHLLRDRHDNIWLGGNDGLWRYDGTTFTQISKRFTGFIIEDSAGNIWASAESETYTDWALKRFDTAHTNDEHPAWEEYMAGEGMFFGLLETNNGNLWAGTLSGAYRYDGETFTDFKATSKQ